MNPRSEVYKWIEKAGKAAGRPGAADVDALKRLWNKRKELSDFIPSGYKLKWNRPDPDWTSWPSIAACFTEYHAALVDRDNKGAQGLAAFRLQGI